MSSLSLEDLFAAEPELRADHPAHSAVPGRPRNLSAPWSTALGSVCAVERTRIAASAWTLSLTRRALECAIAMLALIAFAPLMFCVALLVRLGSRGPVFFRQRRMGRDGTVFTLYKFRSMRQEPGNNSCITVRGDSRITPIGGLLRRYKLDELPQFWNVLRGDMALVGPRPKLPHHEALHMACRPGITGAATLAFRNEEELFSEVPEDQLEAFYEGFVKPAKAQLDLEYMAAATLGSDLSLLWRTAASCLLSGKNFYHDPVQTIAGLQDARRAPGKVTTGSGSHSAVPDASYPVELSR